MRYLLLGLLSFASMASASDVPACRPYCGGRDLYTNGYKVCGGGECWCEYTIVPSAPQCPAKPPKHEKGDFPLVPVAQAD